MATREVLSFTRPARSQEERTVHRLEVAALCLSAAALLLCLVFVWNTTGGTLFVFSVAAPAMVMIATIIVAGTTIREFRQAHRLFAIEHRGSDEIIFGQGDPGDCAYFIRKGTVAVVDEESNSTVRTLAAGEYFGEIALVTNQLRTATVRTTSQVEVAVLGKENFLNMMRLLPTTEEEILHTIQTRVMEDRARHVEDQG